MQVKLNLFIVLLVNVKTFKKHHQKLCTRHNHFALKCHCSFGMTCVMEWESKEERERESDRMGDKEILKKTAINCTQRSVEELSPYAFRFCANFIWNCVLCSLLCLPDTLLFKQPWRERNGKYWTDWRKGIFRNKNPHCFVECSNVWLSNVDSRITRIELMTLTLIINAQLIT